MKGGHGMKRMNLSENWQVTYGELHWGGEMVPAILEKEEGWLPARLPCDIHMPLIEAGIIKDPVVGDYSLECEWTEQKSWWFKKVFYADEKLLEGDVLELTLESLDAEGDVYLNGFHLGHQKSAFYPFIRDVKDYIRPGENVLLVRVTSGLEQYSQQDISPLVNTVGVERKDNRSDRRRIMVRKPQYVYGWDWGPRVASCGIMKDAYLLSYKKVALRGVHAVTRWAGEDALLAFEVEVENLHPFATREGVIRVDIDYMGEKVSQVEKEALLLSGRNYIQLEALVEKARLWWPNGMGEQPLYTIRVSVEAEGAEDRYPAFRYGIRTLKLDLSKTKPGERLFAFEINGVKAFAKGGNWIPADAIYARVTDEKYDILLSEARDAHFNMLRIWGGGIYERDVFYEKCDEYGIMIWHDFMFACAQYPDHLEWFQREVEREMDYQTRRLRNHPSLVLWCGNNENHWGFDEWWTGERQTDFLGGAICYNQIAPSVVRRNCPNIPYWNSSPYGGEHPNGNEVGDRHHWGDCTMNPDMEKRITPEEYDKVRSKFISEYGYIGPCRKSSIIAYHGGAPVDRKGKIWEMHNNTFEKATVPAGIAKHYTDPEALDLDEYLLYGGLCQGLMLGYSLEAIRFKEDCYGSLFWMYDDCWGEVGWTIIDYYLKRKPSYYFVKRAFAPLKLIMREERGRVKVMGINDTSQGVTFRAEYGYTSFDGTLRDVRAGEFFLAPYSRSLILAFDKGDHDFRRGLCFVNPERGKGLLPAVLRPGIFRELILPKTELHITDFQCDGNTASFTVRSDRYAHAVHFNLDDHVKLSDEYFDLLPGETRQVMVWGVAEGFSQADLKPSYVWLPYVDMDGEM